MSPDVVLFDGVCNLCNGAVQFILDRDAAARFSFASIQSERGQEILRAHGVAPTTSDPDTVYLLEGGRLTDRSTAALRIARHLTLPWRLLAVFLVVPAQLRDLAYRFVAHYRYRWFGRTDQCRIPTPELRARMLG